MKANLSELRYQATLNKQGYKELANGNTIPTNEPIMTFRFGYYRMSLVADVQANVLDQLVNTVTIFTRHSDQFVNDGQHSVTIGSITYNIKNINSDFSINGCDTITLKKVGA